MGSGKPFFGGFMKEISLHDAVRTSALGAGLSEQQVEVLAGLVGRETFDADGDRQRRHVSLNPSQAGELLKALVNSDRVRLS